MSGVHSKLNFGLAKRHCTASDKRQNLPSIIALAYFQAICDPRKDSVIAVCLLVDATWRLIGGTDASLSPAGRSSTASLMDSMSPSVPMLSQTSRAYKNIPSKSASIIKIGFSGSMSRGSILMKLKSTIFHTQIRSEMFPVGGGG